MPIKPTNTSIPIGYGGAESSPFGPQPDCSFILPVVKSLLNNDPDYELIFERVAILKIDLEIIQHSNNHKNDLMSLPTVFIAVEIIEDNLPPVPATSIDSTALDVVIGVLVKEYSAVPCEM